MMIRNSIAWLFCVATLATTLTSAFVTPNTVVHKQSALSMALVTPPPPTVMDQSAFLSSSSQQQQVPSAALNSGVQNFIQNSKGFESSSMELSLVERRPPTPEEVEAKKRNFNLIFWGGGFVAPFLATFFYFGFKFWEK